MTSTNSELETAIGSLQEAKDNLYKATDKADVVTKAIDSFIAKVRDIRFKAKVDDADIEKLTDDRKKLIGDESKLLENHRNENKEIPIRHFYDMSNMMSRNEGVAVKWLGKGFALDILVIFPLYGHFGCLFCRIIHRQVSGGWGDLKSPHPSSFYSLCHFSSLFSKRLEHFGDTLFLLLHVRMHIEIEGCCDVGMTEQHAYGLVVAVAFNAACRKAVA